MRHRIRQRHHSVIDEVDGVHPKLSVAGGVPGRGLPWRGRQSHQPRPGERAKAREQVDGAGSW